METTDKISNEQESLQIIQDMINSAKNRISDNGFHYLLWGWLVLIAALSQYVLIVYIPSEFNYLPWVILMPLGGIVAGIVSSKQKQKRKVKTFVNKFLSYLWLALGFSLFIIIFLMFRFSITFAYPVIIILYGIGLFVSGCALGFRPLVIGGISCFVISIVTAFFNFEVQLLLISLAVLVGYIIPGYILKSRFKNETV